MLRDSRALTSLAVAHSEVSSEAFVAIATSLAMNATLTSLDASHNPLGVSDGLVIEEAPPPDAAEAAEGAEGEEAAAPPR